MNIQIISPNIISSEIEMYFIREIDSDGINQNLLDDQQKLEMYNESKVPIDMLLKLVKFYFQHGGEQMSESKFEEFMDIFNNLTEKILEMSNANKKNKVVCAIITTLWIGILTKIEAEGKTLNDNSLKNCSIRAQQIVLKDLNDYLKTLK